MGNTNKNILIQKMSKSLEPFVFFGASWSMGEFNIGDLQQSDEPPHPHNNELPHYLHEPPHPHNELPHYLYEPPYL